MPSSFLPRTKPFNKYAVLRYQQQLLQLHFPFLKCSINNHVLTCTGLLQPADCTQPYRIKIECVAAREPKSTILYPEISPSLEIHMYEDHSLCLHYAPDMKWNERIKIYQYTVPWISEWITYYEIYLMNGGKWEGKESPAHLTESDKNENIDKD